MNKTEISRKNFIRSTTLALMGMSLVTELASANNSVHNMANQSITGHNSLAYTLKNVLLETGFEYEQDQVSRTTTALFTLEITQGKISAILPNDPNNSQAIDAKGMLMLPAFKDMHIHLDKTFYAGPWQAVQRHSGGVKAMIELEQRILPELLESSTYRAEKLIELLQSKGTSFARSHVNIEPTSKLQSLKNLEKALENKKAGFDTELVAFPQHGVFYTDSAPYLEEAAKLDIDFIGGVDPYTLDGAIEKTVDFTVQLALDNQKGIDIHLHETGDSGRQTIEYLIKKVNENPSLKHKTFLSHAFVLGRLQPTQQEAIAEKLSDAGIGIVSTIPFGNLIMPIPTLYKHNVTVMAGNDSIIDHWNTHGTGSVLEKANVMAQLYNYNTEFLLSRSLKLATGDILPLDDKGNQQWPKVGDTANVVLVQASCSAEAVSRVSPIVSLIHQGNIVY